jgi:hypothetical protein
VTVPDISRLLIPRLTHASDVRSALSRIPGFRRLRERNAHRLLHGVIPVAGLLVLVPVFLAGAGIPSFGFVSKLAAPLRRPVRGALDADRRRLPHLSL